MRCTLQQSASSQLNVAGWGDVEYTTLPVVLLIDAAVPPINVHDVPLLVEMYVSLYTPPPHTTTLLVLPGTVVGVPAAVV